MALEGIADWEAEQARSRLDIVDLLHLYARCLDQHNAEGALLLFTESAFLSFGEAYGGPQRAGGRALTQLADADTSHHVSNVQIAFLSSDRAAVHSYAIVRVAPASGPATTVWGEFEDRVARTAEGWRFDSRIWRAHLQDGPPLALAKSEESAVPRPNVPPPPLARGTALPGLGPSRHGARDAGSREF